MKYIITSKQDKRITDISETIGYETNGNIILDNGTQIACFREVEVHEVESIPEGVCAEKYCYTEEDGFYLNEDYQVYISDDDRISALEDAVNSILGF